MGFEDLVTFDTNGKFTNETKIHEVDADKYFISWTAHEHADGSYSGAYISLYNASESEIVEPIEFSSSISGRQYSGPLLKLGDGSVVPHGMVKIRQTGTL